MCMYCRGTSFHFVLSFQCDEPEQVENGENENQYVNGPGTSAEDIPKDGDVLVADTDCPAIQQEATPANFISFGWQIASGMVKSHSTY